MSTLGQRIFFSFAIEPKFVELSTIECVQEKEKELGVRNIYALRQNKPPHHLDGSVQSTPVSSSSGRRLPLKPKLRSIRPLRPLDASNSVSITTVIPCSFSSAFFCFC